MEEKADKEQLPKSIQRELPTAEIILPNSPQIVISSQDLQSIANLERILQDRKELNLTVIDVDVYVAQMQQARELGKERFEQEEAAKEAKHRRIVVWTDNIFLKLVNLGMFAAGFYLVTQ